MKNFIDWLNETMTSTSSVAGFSRIAIPLVFRQWPPEIATDVDVHDDQKKKKKRIKKQPQLKEGSSETPFLHWLVTKKKWSLS